MGLCTEFGANHVMFRGTAWQMQRSIRPRADAPRSGETGGCRAQSKSSEDGIVLACHQRIHRVHRISMGEDSIQIVILRPFQFYTEVPRIVLSQNVSTICKFMG